MIRKTFLRQVKGYRQLYRHCEDLDLWLRIAEITELRHLRDSGAHAGMWRAVARLLRFGDPRRAIRLAATLATP